ncbi:hypothetical protein [Hoyosella rhizosphaerae]|uniref:Uncharacterized protein n=1 Tax=Hoyosella rhizosphaerae TaxID=1755582 RepID=A0A916UHU4_9ACTN|nr:hypothetical protein [Hoyosella rhizosphaerae]GGC74138.1 hypothetical protein GCM10011410_29200 [Hoyosella rhizosphaerae]
MDTDGLVHAIAELEPRPRERRWASLSLCILDAVWSLGARYDSVVVPLVRRVATDCDISTPTVPFADPIGPDPMPLSAFLDRFDLQGLLAVTNRQNTSTVGGIRKADAVLRHTRVFVDNEIDELQDAHSLMGDGEAFKKVNRELRGIPGEGTAGIRRGYLWMLIGDGTRIKPDRMVLRWLKHHGCDLDPKSAEVLIDQLVPAVSEKLNRTVTAWEIDHAIWQAGRKLKP